MLSPHGTQTWRVYGRIKAGNGTRTCNQRLQIIMQSKVRQRFFASEFFLLFIFSFNLMEFCIYGYESINEGNKLLYVGFTGNFLPQQPLQESVRICKCHVRPVQTIVVLVFMIWHADYDEKDVNILSEKLKKLTESRKAALKEPLQ